MTMKALDLDQAWRRVKWDIEKKTFTSTAFEITIIEHGLKAWLDDVRSKIDSGVLLPHACEAVDVPKEGFNIRPGAHLNVHDQLIYAALVQEMYASFRAFLQTSKTVKDYSNTLRPGSDVPWVAPSHFGGWAAFQQVSIKRLDKGSSHVLFTDLAGFYENIDIGRLRDVLRTVPVPDELLEELIRLLRHWAEPRARGIPQSTTASHLLAKIYLESVDRRLEREGFDHVRYVDDFRIFTNSELDAKKALLRLTSLLREIGLNVQSQKTVILPADKARDEIDGKIPEIGLLGRRLMEAVKAEGFQNPYLRSSDLESLEEEQSEVAINVLESAFEQHFLDNELEFDKSLFHYLLHRLRPVGSRKAVNYCLDLLITNPIETAEILKYLSAFKEDEDLIRAIAEFTFSNDAMYDYQIFQILRWMVQEGIGTESSLSVARAQVRDLSRPTWLRSYAFALLGQFGDDADFATIVSEFPRASTDLQQAIVLCSLKKQTPMARNAFYARFGSANLLSSLAVEWAKST